MSALDTYRRSLDELETALAAVTTARWETTSPCEAWTVSDIAGHVTWGQLQMRCWASGEEYRGLSGGPGAAQPRIFADPDPMAQWRAARAAGDAALEAASLETPVQVGSGSMALAAMVTIFANDALIHAWDIRHAIRTDDRLPVDLVAASHAWARENVMRMPGFFGPELTAPAGADEQTRWLAYLGRAG